MNLGSTINPILLVIAGLQVLTTVVTVVSFVVIKFNDLKHLQKDIEELKAKTSDLIKRVFCVEGRLFEKNVKK